MAVISQHSGSVAPLRRLRYQLAGEFPGWWSPLKFHCQNENPPIIWIRLDTHLRSTQGTAAPCSRQPGTRAPEQGSLGSQGGVGSSQPACFELQQRPPIPPFKHHGTITTAPSVVQASAVLSSPSRRPQNNICTSEPLPANTAHTSISS